MKPHGSAFPAPSPVVFRPRPRKLMVRIISNLEGGRERDRGEIRAQTRTLEGAHQRELLTNKVTLLCCSYVRLGRTSIAPAGGEKKRDRSTDVRPDFGAQGFKILAEQRSDQHRRHRHFQELSGG